MKNKKYYIGEEVNVKKVVKEVDSIYNLLRGLYDGLNCVRDSKMCLKIQEVEMKLIDLSEDLKGNKKERVSYQ
jgi:hypothetical protein